MAVTTDLHDTAPQDEHVNLADPINLTDTTDLGEHAALLDLAELSVVNQRSLAGDEVDQGAPVSLALNWLVALLL